jgi:ABC-type arginine transport system ATPase subunit
MATILQTNQLTKHYGRHRGIIDVTCEIQEGEVFGFLGPNGAAQTARRRGSWRNELRREQVRRCRATGKTSWSLVCFE